MVWWGPGPTALALKQANGWTCGLLLNHVLSFAGDEDRADLNGTFMHPLLSFLTKTKTTFGLNSESTYNL